LNNNLNKTADGADLVLWFKTRGDNKTSFKIEALEPDGDQD
jgi:hypothetical protein